MKISNSKKELARIISENGGWRDGAAFSAQDGDGTGSMDFFKSKPIYDKDYKYWRGEYALDERIKRADVTIKNFHQTILSREEYFHLYPAPDADGWIEWSRGLRPVGPDELVDVKYANGTVERGFGAGGYAWNWSGDGLRIIAYRPHQPEQAQPQSPVDMAFDIIKQDAKPESKPTIEQLAADYRNRKDYADRKQDEADAAKADADAKMAELVAAGKSLGLVVSIEPIETPSGKPWAVGDGCIIEECSIKPSLEGCAATIKAFDFDDKELPYHVILSGSDDTTWVNRIAKQ